MKDILVDLSSSQGCTPQSDAPPRHAFVRDGEDLKFFIDNSSLEKFQTCPLSAFYYIIKRRQRPPSPALSYGTAAHNALEVLYKHAGNWTDAVVEAAKLEVHKHFLNSPAPEGEWRDETHCTLLIDKYIQHYSGNDPIKPILHNGEFFVENAFEIELGKININGLLPFSEFDLTGSGDNERGCNVRNIRVFWTGKIDVACDHLGGFYVFDHKTTSMEGATFYKQFELGQQPMGYAWVLWQLTGRRPNGFIVNVLGSRKPTKTGRTYSFNREVYQYREDQLLEWHQDTQTLVSDFLSHMLRDYFPKSTVWCVGKYGTCPYHEVCTLPFDSRMSMLNNYNFVNVTWDPREKE